MGVIINLISDALMADFSPNSSDNIRKVSMYNKLIKLINMMRCIDIFNNDDVYLK
jgi:hypothetical protein